MMFRPKQAICRSGIAAGLLTLAALQAAAAAPSEKVLFNFGVVKGGRNPQASLTPGPGGIYYGTTDSGGATGNGAVFALVPPAAGETGWKERVIYSFSGPADGTGPSSGLLIDGAGALYGVASGGGAQNSGTVFKLTPPAPGQSGWGETTLHSFTGSDGAAPFGTLIAGADGVLYGSTAGGGAAGGGVVFSVTPPADGGTAWSESTLYGFKGDTDGASPSAGLYRDATSGALFGMTSVGGLNNAGTIYRLKPPASGGAHWAKDTLYNFRGVSDGAYPVGGLALGQDGKLYGVTNSGGLAGWGTVFSLTPQAHEAWLENVIFHFNGRLQGGAPSTTPVIGPDGTLYGASNAGGNTGSGTAFALSPPAKGTTWTETLLASFDGPNGVNPAGLTLDPSGVLIGTTLYGGTLGDGGGTIFSLTPPQNGGSGWTQAVLHQFPYNSTDAVSPSGALLMGKAGVLYGSANFGGVGGQGAVFQLTPPAAGQTAWQRTVLHSFNGTDGGYATGDLVQDANGVLYGVTSDGGKSYGTVYALTPPAAGKTGWTEKVIHAFTGVSTGDGAYPGSGLIADASGALYGTAGSGGIPSSDDTVGNGIVFKLTPPASGKGAWKETVLYRFSGADGSTPDGTLLLDASGALYGTTYVGGSAGEGTVFKLTPPAAGGSAWTETVLHSFNAGVGNDGAIPGAEQLAMDASGALYGTANQGGANNLGAVFKLAPPSGTGADWTETVIHSFAGTDGSYPFAGLLLNKAGALFGVTPQGGSARYYGNVFKLVPPSTGTAWTFKVLHNFDPTYNQDGGSPSGALIKDAHGNLYGPAQGGGFGNSGVVFEVTP